MVVKAEYLFTALWYCVCIFSCIDTDQFVYASLSQTLYPSVIGLLMIIVFGIDCICKRQIPGFNVASLPALGLAAYILLHGLFIREPEIYKQGYLVSTLLLMVVLSQSAKMNHIKTKHLECGILLISVINITYLIAQSIGVMDSGNSFFKVTGTTDNPNTAAITLTISIPFIIQKIEQRKHVAGMFFLLISIVSFVISLKCRTAYLGIGCIIIYLAFQSSRMKQTLLKMTNTKFGVFKGICLVMILIVLVLLCYNWKKESADGRLFIWQRDCEMILNNPLGYGYGKYEVEYNLYQSHYFSSNNEAYLQSNLATANGSAYNDVLEHGIQGGVVGGALHLMFLLFSVYCANRNKKKTCVMALTAVAVMSMTNTIYCGISPWLMTMAAMSIGLKDGERQIENTFNRYSIFSMVFISSVFLLCRNTTLLVSQSALRIYKDERNYSIEDVAKLYPSIGTSEAYWRYRAECNERINNWYAADTCYAEARKYTSAPLLLFKSSVCKEYIGDYNSAIVFLRTAVFMLPKNFSLKYHLMMMYDRAGRKELARLIANEIISTPEKINNESVHFIKEEAEKYLK